MTSAMNKFVHIRDEESTKINVFCNVSLDDEEIERLSKLAEDCDVSETSEEEEENEVFTESVKAERVRFDRVAEKKEEAAGKEDVALSEGVEMEEASPSIWRDRPVTEMLCVSLT